MMRGMCRRRNPWWNAGFTMVFRVLTVVVLSVGVQGLRAQTASLPVPALEPTTRFDLPAGPLTIRQQAVPNHPFTVTGASGAILGMQDGSVELWQFPLKFFSGLRLQAEIDGYAVPIDLNAAAGQIEVSPDHTTITYAHAAITVKQHMFVPAGEGSTSPGGVILFEIHSIRPATITISLTPSMVRQWPAPQFGQPSWDWQTMGAGGAYTISTDNPQVFGMIGMANVKPGYISPYQERPHALPVQFLLRYDPAKDAEHLFPLLCESSQPGERNTPVTIAAMRKRLVAKAEAIPAVYAATRKYYEHFFDQRLLVRTPDEPFNLAMQWAELALEKAQVTTPAGETGLVAGWYPSFDSARPGYGWFFGRDTLWSLYAIDSYGDLALARRAMEFLIKRQRDDGKMMHEYSQSADTLTGEMAWSNFPYEYAAADSTPLYLLAMRDYVWTSGDTEFLRKHWESLKKAYRFERAHDSDGDGVYDNSQGTGWVEGWPPKLPQQELYLAALDRDATRAMVQLARWMNDGSLADEASAMAAKLAKSVESYRRQDGTYAFSRNSDGSYDATLTVYPSVALWWSGKGMDQPGAMLTNWASSHFETDWGTRAVADNDKVYDPISYHQGTVWPLFTGWTSLAEYRGGRPLAGYAALMSNVNLTWVQDPGSITELLSGRFYQPLGRSSTHQLWSSAMALAPAMRGLFGLEGDATRHVLYVNPHLPASWGSATVSHLRVGEVLYDVALQRTSTALRVTAVSQQPTVLCMREQELGQEDAVCREAPAKEHLLNVPLAAVELELQGEGPLDIGEETSRARVIAEKYGAHTVELTVEGRGGDAVEFLVRQNRKAPLLRSDKGVMQHDRLKLKLPDGAGFVTDTITISW